MIISGVKLPTGEGIPVKIIGGEGVGGDGKSLEFNWDGTQLGIRQEGEDEYVYVDLRGPQGEPGTNGSPGADGDDGNDGRGISDITFDEEENEFVFAMSDSTEIRVPMPE